MGLTGNVTCHEISYTHVRTSAISLSRSLRYCYDFKTFLSVVVTLLQVLDSSESTTVNCNWGRVISSRPNHRSIFRCNTLTLELRDRIEIGCVSREKGIQRIAGIKNNGKVTVTFSPAYIYSGRASARFRLSSSMLLPESPAPGRQEITYSREVGIEDRKSVV